MAISKPDYPALLQTLVQHGVDFIVVGGVCAVLHGAPVSTFDIDVVHSRDPDNLHRLISALQDLDAYYRGRGGHRLTPQMTHLASKGHHLLMTRVGPLDVLGTIAIGHSYEDLLEHTVELEVSGFQVALLTLEKLIEIKAETGLDKDKAMLPILRRTLEERVKR